MGKVIRVVVFAGVEGAEEARAAGADFVGEDDLIEKIEAGWDDFEVGLATPQIMPKIGKLGRILGRKGLMPNPRSGTMVQPQDMGRAVEEAKGGRTEYRTERRTEYRNEYRIEYRTECRTENRIEHNIEKRIECRAEHKT